MRRRFLSGISYSRKERALRRRAFTATLTTLYLSPEAELRPFEIPCFLSYNPESFALPVQSVGVTDLAADRFCFGVLHRQCAASERV
ncbi:hypothetical protein CKO_00551 [Citrobacter koseri ATCC BAA-895]|uniref:Uncharacterized protein n=1 Tax=Citrobacter koseri (strain ATCC BAA-895 / CDC 4225-83 / SGSC4696) TaxID=290338 RepID=A8ADZ4_CITK8|nr:hypothetical protein CKO_00551 [Citrobacter koseri ATCC BAA-895]